MKGEASAGCGELSSVDAPVSTCTNGGLFFFCACRSDFGRRASLRHLLVFAFPSRIGEMRSFLARRYTAGENNAPRRLRVGAMYRCSASVCFATEIEREDGDSIAGEKILNFHSLCCCCRCCCCAALSPNSLSLPDSLSLFPTLSLLNPLFPTSLPSSLFFFFSSLLPAPPKRRSHARPLSISLLNSAPCQPSI